MEISIFITTLIFGCILHYGVQKIFVYYRKFDDFNHRSSHKTLATRTGGIGIYIVLFILSFYFYLNKNEVYDFSILIPLGIMFFIGVYDDFYKADFKLKFFFQIIVAKILIDQGYLIDDLHGLFGLNEISRLIGQVITVFLFLVVVNGFNFIDGIDGLAITEIMKYILVIEICSFNKTPFYVLNIILIGSLLPLYFFNFRRKNKVFLGDAGSLLLGTYLMVLSLYFLGSEYTMVSNINLNKGLFLGLLIFYPLIDLTRIFVVRMYNKKSPFHADNNHLHHILLNKTKSHLITTIIISLLSLLPLIVYYLG